MITPGCVGVNKRLNLTRISDLVNNFYLLVKPWLESVTALKQFEGKKAITETCQVTPRHTPYPFVLV